MPVRPSPRPGPEPRKGPCAGAAWGWTLLLAALLLAGGRPALGAPPVRLVRPAEGALVTAKRPLIECEFAAPVQPGGLLVLLDGVDVTGAVEATPAGFRYRPVEILPPGPHQLEVAVTEPGGAEARTAFTFSTRHSRLLREAASQNVLSAVSEVRLAKPADVSGVPAAKVEAELADETRLGEDAWSLDFHSRLRYLDQDAPVAPPLEKGLRLATYLLGLTREGERLRLRAELGDVRIELTPATIQGLARRGGRMELAGGGLRLEAFSVDSAPAYGPGSEVGVGTGAKDHLAGARAGFDALDGRFRAQALYAEGGEEAGTTLGLWAGPAGDKRGRVLGLAAAADLFGRRLTTEAELDLSRFDPDTSDEFDAANDKAWKVRAAGFAGRYSYEAAYEYTGPAYDVIGNQGLQKDREGFRLAGGAAFGVHALNLSFSRFHDNVDGSDLFARTTTTQAALDYGFSGIPSLPAGLNLQVVALDADGGPATAPPLRNETTTAAARLNWMKGAWNAGLQAAYSVQDDRTPQGNDSTTAAGTLTLSYTAGNLSLTPSISFNRARLPALHLRTDTTTVTTALRGTWLGGRLSGDLAGTYSRMRTAGDAPSEQDNIQADARLAWNFEAKALPGPARPAAGLLLRYGRNRDRTQGTGNEDLRLFLVLSAALPFAF
ncbi:hypothetical protein G3N55_06080 [Dissulfurirhabdus thermomarina]|uniref:Uncharacterized protein n=1 Tax=Dissulfurirhabdus thermomarina TaxID=1765737 RepID=A0A6N9TMQ0_DISTH|nr:hypothetical protein [Dissulfurirhabdus thermomarina]NDY42409.1 hypothetical protein [Dissulfurirhabdus thermomarina]NMX23821.1 hypothetical protein [Dissulfurirhabdus thermomarina]